MDVRGKKTLAATALNVDTPNDDKAPAAKSTAHIPLGPPSGFETKAPLTLRQITQARQASKSTCVDAIPPLSAVISYDAFERLACETVARVPDLQPLWTWQDTCGHDDADQLYLLGGALRGLLIWLRDQVVEHGEDAVAKMAVPTTEQLLRQVADRDVLALGGLASPADKVVTELGEGWETLAPLDHRNNIALGGPTIEKVGIGPRGIEDHFGGLRHFYEGKLVFIYDGTQHSSVQHGYSVLAEALRLLRFAYELPGLEVTDASWDALAKVGPAEHGALGRSAHGKYLVEKPLVKFLKASGEKPLVALEELRGHNLLSAMADGPYQLPRALLNPSEKPHALKTTVARLVAAGWNAEELRDARRLFRLTPAEQVEFTQHCLEMIGTTPEAAVLLDFEPGIESSAFMLALADGVESLLPAGDFWQDKLSNLRSSVSFFENFFATADVAATTNLEVTFGISVPRDGGHQQDVQNAATNAVAAMFEDLPRRPESEKVELADFLFRVIDEEIDAPYGSVDGAIMVLTKLDTADAGLQLKIFGRLAEEGRRRKGYETALVSLSNPQPELLEALDAHVAEKLTTKNAKIGMSVTSVAFALGRADALLRDTVDTLKTELASPEPSGRVLGEMMRRLYKCPNPPEDQVQGVMQKVDEHLRSTPHSTNFDALAAGFGIFAKTQGRLDLVERMGSALMDSWSDETSEAYALGTWLSGLAEASEATVDVAYQWLTARYPDGVPSRVAHSWNIHGPKEPRLVIAD